MLRYNTIPNMSHARIAWGAYGTARRLMNCHHWLGPERLHPQITEFYKARPLLRFERTIVLPNIDRSKISINSDSDTALPVKCNLSIIRGFSATSMDAKETENVHDSRIHEDNDNIASISGNSADEEKRQDDSPDSDGDESLLGHYESLIELGEVIRDPHQIHALKELDRLREECIPYLEEINESNDDKDDGEEEPWSVTSLFSMTPSWAEPWTGSDARESQHRLRRPLPRGVYLHGGVGCGKTYCMNLFYDSLVRIPNASLAKVHFHKFMLNIHKRMHKAKMIKNLHGDEVIDYVIQSTLSEGKVLCFDEFQVTDVADALILRRLFTGLLKNGAVVVATSNRPPEDLYKGGLQRDLFLPFIDLLEESCATVSMWESDMDYRLVQGGDGSRKEAQKVYFVEGDSDGESNGNAKDSFETLFRRLTKESSIGSMVLEVQGREVFIPKASEEHGIARFSFYDLCGAAKGAADFLAIGERFHTVLIEDVPRLKLHEVNLVRRWITLIDALYECHVKLVVHAASNPDDIFEVDLEDEHCDEVFAFDRTRSRMEEMRSERYLRKKWVGSRL